MISDSIPIAALEHAAYCMRQWGLIHLDRFFADNEDTVRGHHTHETVDHAGTSRRGSVRTERRLPVWSEHRAIHGYCDVVEFEGDTVLPIEYKSGKRAIAAAEIQVCAQAMCLEEMLDVEVPHGAIYLVGSNQMLAVPLTAALRAEVDHLITSVRAAMAGEDLPTPANDRRCGGCSFQEHCQPQLVADRRKVGTLYATTWHV